MQEKPPPVDPDTTAQLERPPADANVAPPPSGAGPVRRPVDRWSTVFTVFAAVARGDGHVAAGHPCADGQAVRSSQQSPAADEVALS